MRAFLESILGSYTPVTYQSIDYLYDENGLLLSETVTDFIPSGLAGVDWTFVLTGVAFLILLWCALRILGGIICKIS